jgi:hypothetical protein
MIVAVAARWLLTVVFGVAGLGAVLPQLGPTGTAHCPVRQAVSGAERRQRWSRLLSP